MKTYNAPWGRTLIVILSLLLALSVAGLLGLPVNLLTPNAATGDRHYC